MEFHGGTVGIYSIAILEAYIAAASVMIVCHVGNGIECEYMLYCKWCRLQWVKGNPCCCRSSQIISNFNSEHCVGLKKNGQKPITLWVIWVQTYFLLHNGFLLVIAWAHISYENVNYMAMGDTPHNRTNLHTTMHGAAQNCALMLDCVLCDIWIKSTDCRVQYPIKLYIWSDWSWLRTKKRLFG